MRGHRHIQQRVSPSNLKYLNLAGKSLGLLPWPVIVVFFGQCDLASFQIDSHNHRHMTMPPFRIRSIRRIDQQIAALRGRRAVPLTERAKGMVSCVRMSLPSVR